MARSGSPECAAIEQSFARALKAVSTESGNDDRFSSAGFHEAMIAHLSMRTEEDFEMSNSFFSQNSVEDAATLGDAMQRKRSHEMLTGHRVPQPDFRAL